MKGTIKITGMTCSACSAKIERMAKKLDGVKSLSVNLMSETLSYDIKNHEVLKNIKDLIKKLGYGYREESSILEDEKIKQKENKVLFNKMIIAVVFGAILLYVAMAKMFEGFMLPLPMIIDPMKNPLNFAFVQIILLIPIVISGFKFYTIGFKNLFKFAPNMDSLIAISTFSATLYSLYATYQIYLGEVHFMHSLYFESAGVIIALILLGKYLENNAKTKTSSAIRKLMDLAPKNAIVIRDGKEETIDAKDVLVCDIILIKPGMGIPVDGEIISGDAYIDESMLSGEALAVHKQKGDSVYAGTINLNSAFKFKALKVSDDTVLSGIVKFVMEAQGGKAPIAKLADSVSGYFVPFVIILAIIAFIYWMLVGKEFSFSLTIFISILVIACPCALGLATPTAIMVASGRGALSGILIKSGEALEVAHNINTVLFDKTGTITLGKPKVTDILVDDIKKDEFLKYVYSLEKNSEHPLASAICEEYKTLKAFEVKDIKAISGRGIVGYIGGKEVLIGSLRLMDESDIDVSNLKDEAIKLANEAKTVMFVSIDKKLKGVIALADVIKETSKEAIKKLNELDIKTVMVTGDNEKAALAIGKEVGIKEVLAEVLPTDKAKKVKEFKDRGAAVAFVGDGINDAPALSVSDVGIAIGRGTDIAIESADIVLMHSDLLDVVKAINLSKQTIKNIKQNLFFAFFYNIIGLPIAAGVLYAFGGPLLNPMFAAFAMSFSSVSVVTNALRIKNKKI